MDVIEIKTLVDITNTKVNRLGQGSQLSLDQQRNFVTLMQCIEIRSIVSYEDRPMVENIDIKNLGFGSSYKGRQNIWTFRIIPDRESVYLDNDGNPVGLLEEDLHEVPIIKNLTETVNIDKSIFDCRDIKYKNIIIKAITGIF
jgi:hypothetical protein